MTEHIPSASLLWGESFTPNDHDIEFIYNLLLEEGVPLDLDQLSLAVVRERLQREVLRQAQLASDDILYQPSGMFNPGEKLVFPASGFLRGVVLDVRKGNNPDLGEFHVLRVKTDNDELEFAAGLADHKLNSTSLESLTGSGEISAEQILAEASPSIRKALTARLAKHSDIVSVAGKWFPRALMADVSEGHIHIAEAVLDVAGGGPLPTSAMMTHLELPKHIDPRLASFSLEYALYQDERFDEVGPAGEMCWFLKRLEPAEVLFPPRRLKYKVEASPILSLPEPLAALESELEDEWGSPQTSPEEVSELQVVLPFPHWRVGTLPLSAKMCQIFPHAHEALRIRFNFIDAESEKRFPGWVVASDRFVFGLAEWYQEKGLLPGGYLKVQKTEKPDEVRIQALTRRPIREWVRTAISTPQYRLGFSMQKQPISVEYDEQMVIAIPDMQAVDEIWLRSSEHKVPLTRQVVDVFRELAKLNPQSTVHARTLFSAVNVLTRVPPAPVFRELTSRPYFSHVGDLYFRFEEAQWTQNP